MLQQQKNKTGVAILGTPIPQLQEDPKYQDLLPSSLVVGEELAQAALASEVLILMVAEVPQSEWYPYLGRSQYPKFKQKKVFSKRDHDDKYDDNNLSFWAGLRNLAAQCAQGLVSMKLSFTSTKLQSLYVLIEESPSRLVEGMKTHNR